MGCYKCDCGATFDEPLVSREPHLEVGAGVYETIYTCPEGGDTCFARAERCRCCQEIVRSDEIEHGLCKVCAESVRSRFHGVMLELTEAEADYARAIWNA